MGTRPWCSGNTGPFQGPIASSTLAGRFHLERQREIERFWLMALGLPLSSLGKSVVNIYSKYSEKKRKNKLPYGTCKFTVNSTGIVQTIFGSIQEYGRFERPEWLD
jgi:hypothetical protein